MAVGYAWSLLWDFHLAEDAAQDAFIQVFGVWRVCANPAPSPDGYGASCSSTVTGTLDG